MGVGELNLGQLFFTQKAASIPDKLTSIPIEIIDSAGGNTLTLRGEGMVTFNGNHPPSKHLFTDFIQVDNGAAGYQYNGTITETEVANGPYMRYEYFDVVTTEGVDSYTGTVYHGITPESGGAATDEIAWEFTEFTLTPGENGNMIVNGTITKTPSSGSPETFGFENAEFSQNQDTGLVELVSGRVTDGQEPPTTLMEAPSEVLSEVASDDIGRQLLAMSGEHKANIHNHNKDRGHQR